jgi:hypothetical protein
LAGTLGILKPTAGHPVSLLPGSLGLHEECSDAIIAPVRECLTMKDADMTTKPQNGLPWGGEP